MRWRSFVLLTSILSMCLINGALMAMEKVNLGPGVGLRTPGIQSAPAATVDPLDVDTDGTGGRP